MCSHPEDLDRPEKWDDRNFMKLNKEKPKVPLLGTNNPRHQDILVASQLESSLAERALMVLVNIKFNTSQKCTLLAKGAVGILGCTEC